MVFLPLIRRELGLRARRSGSYWARVAVGAGSVLICLPSLLSSDFSATSNSRGIAVFNSLVAMGLIVAFTACFSTADAISGEKREGTLGLLFLTRVKWPDVIAGKLVSNGIVSLAALLILMPFLMIPVLAGGITGGEAFRKGLALLNILFFALGVGMYVSSWTVERYRAMRRTAILATLILLAPVLIEWMLKSVRAGTGFGLLSPVTALILAGDLEYRTAQFPYWACLGITHGLGWFALLGATLNLRYTGRTAIHMEADPSVPVINQPAGRGWLKARQKLAPVEWLVRSQRGLKMLLWLGAITGLSYHLFFRFVYAWGGWTPRASSFFGSYTYSLPILLINTLSGAFFAWAASRFPIESRRSGEFELLLTTPVGASTLIKDQWKALRHVLIWPLIASLIGALLPGFSSILSLYGGQPRAAFLVPFLTSSAFNVFNLVLGTLALCWVGLWFGMKAPRQSGAIIRTLAVVKGAPYLLSIAWPLLVFPLLMSTFGSSRLVFRPPYYSVWSLPNVTVLLYYVWIIRRTKRRLFAGSATEAFHASALAKTPIFQTQELEHDLSRR